MAGISVGISAPFDTPFLPGVVSNNDVPMRFQVALNGRGYIIDPKQYKRSTLPAIRQPVDQSVEPGEQTLSSEGLWRRSQENWVLGAGQEYLDNRASTFDLFTRAGENQSIRYRFWKSKGVDVWTEGHMTLLPECEQKRTSAATNLLVLAAGSYLYVSDGNELYWTADPTVSSPAWTAAGIAAGDAASAVVAIATDGSTVWALMGSGHVHATVAGAATSTHLATPAVLTFPSALAYANGRLIAACANHLYDIGRAGVATEIGNPANNNPSFTWTGIWGAANVIYAAGYAGSRSEVYSVPLNTSTGALTQPVWATGLPAGELVYAGIFYGGFVVLATSVGLRISDISRSDNGLTYGPAVPVPGGSRCLDVYGEFAWFGWTNATLPNVTNPSTTVQSTGLGRLDLARFTSSNVPAYASDVMATDGVTGTVTSVAVFGGRRYFAVSGSGVWGENANKVSAGYMQSGLVRFGTVEPKIIVGGDWRCNPLVGSIGMIIVKEDGTYVTLAEQTEVNTLGSGGPLDASLAVGEAFQVQMYLKRGDTPTTGPDLRRWTVRAVVTPQRMDEIILPILMRSKVDLLLGEGQVEPYDPGVEFAALKLLESTGAIVRYQEGGTSCRVWVDRVEVAPDKWTDDRTFFNGVILVRLLTVPG